MSEPNGLTGHISVTCSRESATHFSVQIREDSKNLKVGDVDIRLEDGEVVIEAWHGRDDTNAGEIVLRPEQP